MRQVDDHLAGVVSCALTPEPVRIAISDALGLICAEEVQATRALPGFPQAAIDGYAVRAVDVGGEIPIGTQEVQSTPPSLPVVGEVAAGSTQPLRLQANQAVRVSAGAPLPTLADAVLPLEWSNRDTRRVVPTRPVRSGEFVRKIGDDVAVGDIACTPGTIISPAHVGLLAAVGRDKVLAYPRPRVSIISVGNELVDVDRDPGLGQVYDVNSYALAAAAKEAGADVTRVGLVNGEPRRLRERIEGAIASSELLIISGGVGSAASAQVLKILREWTVVDTERIAMHPGSVQGFCVIDDVPVFLVPSNPVAALVEFEVFIRPVIRVSLGRETIQRRYVRARAVNAIASRVGRRGYVRARLMRDADTHDYLVEGLAGATGAPAHLLAGLSEANALIRIPQEVAEVRPGDIVDVLFLSQRN